MTRKKKITLWSILTAISAILMAALLIATPLANAYATVINIYLRTSSYEIVDGDTEGDTQYFKSNFSSEDELTAYEEELCRRVEGEGAVLLLNRNNALPLAAGANVSTFARSSVDLVYGGTGSGAVEIETAPTLKSALTNSGFHLNEVLWDFYSSDAISENYTRTNPAGMFFDDYMNSTGAFLVNEVPWSDVAAATSDSFAAYSLRSVPLDALPPSCCSQC